MARYVVTCNEFLWQGRMLNNGATIEADNTAEILANVALGRLVEQTTQPAAPKAAPAPAPVVHENSTQPGATPTETAEPPADPAGRRRYTRRDLKADE